MKKILLAIVLVAVLVTPAMAKMELLGRFQTTQAIDYMNEEYQIAVQCYDPIPIIFVGSFPRVLLMKVEDTILRLRMVGNVCVWKFNNAVYTIEFFEEGNTVKVIKQFKE